LYTTGFAPAENVILCQLGRRGYFRSCDKDGNCINRYAIVENPKMLPENIEALSSTEPELLPFEVLPIPAMQILCIFAKIVDNLYHPAKM